MGKTTRTFYERFLKPRSSGDDDARRELVLNILLAGMVGFAAILFFVTLSGALLKEGYSGSSPITQLVVLLFFLALYGASRRGFYKPAAFVFVGVFFILATWPIFAWGILLPQGVLTYALVIVMTGVLLGSRAAFIMVLLMTVALATIEYLEMNGTIQFSTDWMSTTGSYSDVIAYAITLTLIAVVAWLSNRERERSLKRAQKSEMELRQERSLLEKKVKERTRELEQAHIEKMLDLQKFAEFGKTTSTLLHELANPLMSASLDLQQFQEANRSRSLNRVRDAIEHMEQYVLAARRQLRSESEIGEFDVAEEIERSIGLLVAKANANGIHIAIKLLPNVKIVGDAVRLNHIVSNLVSNAIDAYDGVERQEKVVEILMSLRAKKLIITVMDKGRGIQKNEMSHLFEPFYTTKSSQRGTGIGLTITKQAVEEAFGGTLVASSNKKSGTEFTVTIPMT